MFTEAMARLAHLLLRLMDFSRSTHGPFTFWTAKPSTSHPALGHTRPASPMDLGPGSRPSSVASSHSIGGRAQSAAEHALDAAVAATSAAAATVAKQYPYEGQQYHLPSRPQSPTSPRSIPEEEDCSMAIPSRSPSAAMEAEAAFTAAHLRAAAHPPRDSVSSLEASMFANGGGGGGGSGVPVVFLHGVGFGVLPYLHFVRDLMKACPSSPFIVLEIPHVALRMCKEAASLEEVAEAAVGAVRSLGVQKACFVGHSYGTFVVSKVVQLHPEVRKIPLK